MYLAKLCGFESSRALIVCKYLMIVAVSKDENQDKNKCFSSDPSPMQKYF